MTTSDARSLADDDQQLRAAETMFAQAIQEAPIGQTLVELDGTFAHPNAALCRITGYSARELTGMTFQQITHPDDVDADVAQAREFAAGRIPSYVMDKRYIRKDGTTVWVRLHGSAIRDDTGEVVRFIAQIEDIDGQKRTEAALAEREAELRLLAENASDIVVRTDIDGVLEWVSPSAYELTGWAVPEILGLRFWELIPEADRSQLKQPMRQLLAGVTQHFETRLRTKDGGNRWFALSVRPLTDESGGVVGFVGGGKDVDSEVAARQALHDSQERFRLLAENASDVVALSAPDRTVVWVSPAVTRALGWTPEELIGTVLSDLVHPDDWIDTERLREESYRGQPIRTPGSPGIVVRLRTKAGGYRWMSSAAEPLFSESGEHLGVVAGLRDVDDLVRAREQAQQRQERVQATLDSLLDPSVLLEAVRDEDGRIIDFVYADANAAACSYNQMSRAELIGARLLDTLPRQAGASLLAMYAATVESGEPLVLDGYGYRPHGGQSEQFFDIRAVKVGDGLSYTWRDVTERHNALAALAASEEAYRLLAENSSDVVVRSRGGATIWVSPSLRTATGWRWEDWADRPVVEFVHPDDHQATVAAIDAAESGTEGITRIQMLTRTDGYHWFDLRSTPYRDRQGHQDGVVSTFRIADEAVLAERELRRRAAHDPLTGLLNRREAIARLGQVPTLHARTGTAYAVMFCDLDNFKTINDTLGHAVGDHVLHTIAKRVRGSVRDQDIVARMGGDEILVVLAGVHDATDADHVAQKIRRAVRPAIPVGETSVDCTVSIGLTLMRPDDTADAVIARADQAMYQAKQQGRDRVVVAESPT